MTKGDNNLEDDISLYRGVQWLERHHITGKVIGSEKTKILMNHNLMILQILTVRRLHHHYHGTPCFDVCDNTNHNDSLVQNDYPALKVILLGGFAFFAAFQHE